MAQEKRSHIGHAAASSVLSCVKFRSYSKGYIKVFIDCLQAARFDEKAAAQANYPRAGTQCRLLSGSGPEIVESAPDQRSTRTTKALVDPLAGRDSAIS